MVLRYCRFFWPCLQMIRNAIARGLTPYQIAKAWGVDRAVIVRAAALQCTLQLWVKKLHQEICDRTANHNGRTLTFMVKFVTRKIGFAALANRWYCYCYPKRYLVV
jgi:RecJ-like exonuclease